ncbi:MAG: hypothetical protein V3V81_07895 [Candidatus Bathyarchaeia archaeon]
MTKKQPWKLPIVFLSGYILAWGSILVDRQMILEEQRRLQEEIDRTRIELKVTSMIDEYNEEYTKQVEWNKKAIESPKEVGK